MPKTTPQKDGLDDCEVAIQTTPIRSKRFLSRVLKEGSNGDANKIPETSEDNKENEINGKPVFETKLVQELSPRKLRTRPSVLADIELKKEESKPIPISNRRLSIQKKSQIIEIDDSSEDEKEDNDIQDFTPFKILEERKKNRIFEYLVHCNSPFQDLPDKQVWMVRKQIPSHIMGKYLRDKKSNKMNEKEEEVESEKEEVEEKKEKEIENIPIKKQKRKEMTKIEEIVDLGFTEKEAIFTLKKFNNNITKAINFSCGKYE